MVVLAFSLAKKYFKVLFRSFTNYLCILAFADILSIKFSLQRFPCKDFVPEYQVFSNYIFPELLCSTVVSAVSITLHPSVQLFSALLQNGTIFYC